MKKPDVLSLKVLAADYSGKPLGEEWFTYVDPMTVQAVLPSVVAPRNAVLALHGGLTVPTAESVDAVRERLEALFRKLDAEDACGRGGAGDAVLGVDEGEGDQTAVVVGTPEDVLKLEDYRAVLEAKGVRGVLGVTPDELLRATRRQTEKEAVAYRAAALDAAGKPIVDTVEHLTETVERIVDVLRAGGFIPEAP